MLARGSQRLQIALDWAGRLLGAGLFLYLLVGGGPLPGEWESLVWLWTHYDPEGGLPALVPLLARVVVIVFLALASLCFLVRSDAVARSPSLRARAIALAATLLLAVTLRLLPPARLSLAEQTAAMSLVAVGNALAIASLIALGRSFSILPQARRLVLHGPYRFVRHPMYLAHELSVLGAVWFYRSWLALVLLLLQLGLQLWRIEEEERLLAAVFPEYREYQQRSWRLLPGLY